MSFFDFIGQGIKGHFDKKKVEQEMLEQMQKEAYAHQMIEFQEQFRKNSFEVAKIKAQEQAEKLSGMQKLRATSKLANMNQGDNPNKSDFFRRFTEYTQKNIAQREKNLKKTALMRETAKNIRNQDMAKRMTYRNTPIANRKTLTHNNGKTKLK